MATLSKKDMAFIDRVLVNGRDSAHREFAGHKDAFGIFFGHKVSKHKRAIVNKAWNYICETYKG